MTPLKDRVSGPTVAVAGRGGRRRSYQAAESKMARTLSFLLLTLEFSWHALTLDPKDTVSLCFAGCDPVYLRLDTLTRSHLRGSGVSRLSCCHHGHSKQISLKAAATSQTDSAPQLVNGAKTVGQRRAQAERRLKGMREAAQRGAVPLSFIEVGKCPQTNSVQLSARKTSRFLWSARKVKHAVFAH
jgi:hypothetical protein